MTYDDTTLFKVLDAKGQSCHGGQGAWHLPKGKRPGKWMPPITDPRPCERGYHVVRGPQVLEWLGPTLWTVEVVGAVIDGADKSVAEQARLLAPVTTWNERTARLFACDCAEAVLPIYEKNQPNDSRPRQAIVVSRAFANGEATRDEWDAARAAARDAARDAAWDAARDAARAAARDAARDAARAAARDAAWDAAWAAARDAQWRNLLAYLNGEKL